MKKILTSLLLLMGLGVAIVPKPASALTFNITYAPSAQNCTCFSQIQTAVNIATTKLSSGIFDNVTLFIQVGWGYVYNDTVSLGSGLAGESVSYLSYGYAYNSVIGYLNNTVHSSTDTTALANAASSGLFASNVPNTFDIYYGLQKPLGLAAANTLHGGYVDGYVGFNSGISWTFDDSGGVAGGTYDLPGVMEHEITEVMGRASGVGDKYGPTTLDLFRCSSGVASFTGGTSNFAIDGCMTDLLDYSTSADLGDTTGDSTNPIQAYLSQGALTFNANDFHLMDVIGWSTVSSPSPVNGVCGSASGVAVTTAPTTNLCNAGNSTAVSGTGPWTWTCNGINGGTNANCSAPVLTSIPAAPVVAQPTVSSQTKHHSISYTVSVHWTQSNVTGDKVYRSVNGGSYSLVKTISTTSTSGSYSDTNVTHGTTYSYYVVASNGAGSGPSSNTVTVTP